MINCRSNCKLAGFALFPLVFLAEDSGKELPFQLSGWQSIGLFMVVLLVVWLLLIWQSALTAREQKISPHDANADQQNPAEDLS
jgi:predicted acyltransferase